MAFGSNKLGEAVIDVVVNPTTVEPGLQEVKTKVETETAAIGRSVETHLTQGFERSVSAFRRFLGAAAGIASVAVLFERLGESISNIVLHFTRAKDAALELQRASRELDISGVNKQIDELNEKVTSGFSNLTNYFNRLTDTVGLTETASREAKTAVLEEERAEQQRIEAIKRRNELQRKADEDEKQRAKERAEARKEELRQIEEELKERQAILDKMHRDEMARVSDRLRAIAEEGRARLAERKKEADESAALAKRVADETQRAFSSGGFQQSIAGPIEELLRDIQANLEALKFGRAP